MRQGVSLRPTADDNLWNRAKVLHQFSNFADFAIGPAATHINSFMSYLEQERLVTRRDSSMNCATERTSALAVDERLSESSASITDF